VDTSRCGRFPRLEVLGASQRAFIDGGTCRTDAARPAAWCITKKVAIRGRLDARGLRLACTAINVELDGRDGGSWSRIT